MAKGVPANNPSAKKRKRIKESIKKTRQMVRWSDGLGMWKPVFVTKAELDVKMGDRAANYVWATECYHLAAKESGCWGMAPFTKAEAFAAWANRVYSWASGQRYWDQLPRSAIEPRNVDDTSRARLKARLQELVTG